MKTFTQYLQETRSHDIFPIKESRKNYEHRMALDLTEILLLDANKIKQKFERVRNEPLVHKPLRKEKIEDIVFEKSGYIDAYPIVSALWSPIAIDDGRHRIAVAAEHGMKIEIATNKQSVDRLKDLK